MKNRGKVIIIMIGAVLFNSLVLTNDREASIDFLFRGAYPGSDYMGTILWFFWFSCISFYFVGTLEEYIGGFGIYELTRGKSRSAMVLKQYSKVIFQLLIIIVVQVVMMALLRGMLYKNTEGVDIYQFMLSFLMYGITVYFLIILQLYFELYAKAQIAMLVLQIYVVLSISLAGLLFKLEKANILLYILVPNFSMSNRTDLLNKYDFTIHYMTALMLLGIMSAIVMFLSIKRIQTMDIF